MKTTSILCSLALVADLAVAAPLTKQVKNTLSSSKTVSFKTRRVTDSKLSKRHNSKIFSSSIDNDVNAGEYVVDVTVGGQTQSLQLDTGSSDTWMISSALCATMDCPQGQYDPNQSSSYSLISSNTFSTGYADGSTAQGDFITDNLVFEDGTTVTSLQMGLAYSTKDLNYGLMGVGFDTLEAAPPSGVYPNIIDDLVSEGLTESKSYSLWLDDLASSSGTIMFGGYDSSKFSGGLCWKPIVAESDGSYQNLNVYLDGAAPSGSAPATWKSTALLDSGTTFTLLPHDLYASVVANLPFKIDSKGNMPCNAPSGSVDFYFGGTKISVPYSELAFPNGDTCTFGIQDDGSASGATLGDTFLRSAYVVYDMTTLNIGFAQTIFS